MKNKHKQISLDQAYDIIKRPITTEKTTTSQSSIQGIISLPPSIIKYPKMS